jgi:hypothetical protein
MFAKRDREDVAVVVEEILVLPLLVLELDWDPVIVVVRDDPLLLALVVIVLWLVVAVVL